MQCTIRVRSSESHPLEHVIERLSDFMPRVVERDRLAFHQGCVQAVLRRQPEPGIDAAAGVRRDGAVAELD